MTTTGRTLKTGDVIRSLNLVEIRRQQRRVATLLNGDPKDIPLISYRQAEASSYRGENFGSRRWPPGIGIHQKTFQMNPNEHDPFYDHSDDPPSTKREQLKRTKDNRLHPLNNSPNDEPAMMTSSSTPLPPIDSHKNNCARHQSPGGARKKPEIRRQMSPATEQSSITRNGHVTRNRKLSNKSRNKSSKPVVKYQHQKLEASAEERYRKYRTIDDGLRKVTSCSTPDVWMRSGSGLSSVSDVSARRRRHVQFQSHEDEENNKGQTKLSSAGWEASDSDQLPMGLEGLRGAADGRTPGFLRSMEDGNTNENNFSNGLNLEDSGRCHPTPVADGSTWNDESYVRLPDLQIYNSNRPVLLPETRRFNPDIGETSRAFVYSYFDHLPPVMISGSRVDELGSDGENKTKSINVAYSKTAMRRK